MRAGKPLLTACLSALAITLLLTLLPHATRHSKAIHSDIDVFQVESVARLTTDNLVDVLIQIPLNERIGKVDWSSGVLTVELRVQPETGRPASWFQDVEKLIVVAFDQLNNVKRVLIRIAENEVDGGRLMAAVDVRRTDSWLQQDLNLLKNANAVHNELWRQRLRLSFTSVWEERIGPVSGFTVKPARDSTP